MRRADGGSRHGLRKVLIVCCQLSRLVPESVKVPNGTYSTCRSSTNASLAVGPLESRQIIIFEQVKIKA